MKYDELVFKNAPATFGQLISTCFKFGTGLVSVTDEEFLGLILNQVG
jgi:hypothetical protein